MKKTVYSFLALLIILITVAAVTAYAEDDPLEDVFSWTATYNGTTIETTFKQNELTDRLSSMLPGDVMTFNVSIANGSTVATRWYMKNWVKKTLEYETIAAWGGYRYQLYYTKGSNVTELYDSDIGGQDQLITQNQGSKEGLEEATLNLDEWFFLDTLNAGETGGTVTLIVSLDGETQGNVYQNTAAEIALQFAVERKTGNRTAVKTGDENNLTPYYILMIVTGLIFLYLALDAYTDRLYKKGKG